LEEGMVWVSQLLESVAAVSTMIRGSIKLTNRRMKRKRGDRRRIKYVFKILA